MHQGLNALLAANQGKGTGVRAEAAEGEARLYLYDVIGWPFIEAQDVLRALGEIGEVSVIHLHLNSPGGDVFEARAIKTILERHSARIVAHIDGLAASAASFLMLAAAEIEIASGAFVMIHNAWGMTIGDRNDHAAQVEVLAKVDATLAADYAARAGGEQAEWAARMDAETWYSGPEAVEAGLADRVFEASAEASTRFDVSAFAHAPQALTQETPEAATVKIDAAAKAAAAQITAAGDGVMARLSAFAATLFQSAPQPVEGGRAQIEAREAEQAARAASLPI